MEHRAFHYGVLLLIGGAHLAILTLRPTSEPVITPPAPLPLVMVTAVSAAPAAAASKPQAAPRMPVAPPPRTPPPPAPRQVATPSTRAITIADTPAPTPAIATAPVPTASPAPAAASPATSTTATNTAAATTVAARGPAAPTAEDGALTPPMHNASYLHNPEPTYPPLSEELGEEGTVILQVAISSNGRATAVNVAKSSGYPRLDNAAKRAAARWTYRPAMRGNTPVDYTYMVPIKFVHPEKSSA